jgi:tetratricopeptide (TPR) repeat protein
MLDGNSQHKEKLLWKSFIVLFLMLSLTLYSSGSWSQGGTYKAPMPKPSNKPAPPPVKKASSSSALAPSSQANKPAGPDYDSEMKKLNALLAANDKNADAFYNRGWLYEVKGDLQMAEKDYTRAIELDKKDQDAYFNRGLLFVKMKKFEEAVKDFSDVIKLDSSSADAYCNRGNAYLQLNKTDQAIQDYETALKIKPDDADILCNRGIAYLAKGNKPLALKDFRKAAATGHAKAREYLKIMTAKS